MTKLSTWPVLALVSSIMAWGAASGEYAFRPRQKASFVAQLRRHLNFAGVLLPVLTCTPPDRHFHNSSCFAVPPGEILLLQKELHVQNIRTTSPRMKLDDEGLMRTNESCTKNRFKSSDVMLGILPSKADHIKAYVSKLKCYVLCEMRPPPGFMGRPPPPAFGDGSRLSTLPVEDLSLDRRSAREGLASTQSVGSSARISLGPPSPSSGAGEREPTAFSRGRPPMPRGEAVLKLVTWLVFLEGDLEAALAGAGATVDCDCRLVAVSAADGAVTEVYLARSRALVGRATLGRWVGERLLWHAEGRLQRASDLRGLTMTCLIAHNWPLTIVEGVNGSLKIGGYIPTVWKILEEYLNFSTECIPTKASSDDELENKIFEYGVDVGLTGVFASLETKERSSVTTKLTRSWITMVVRRRGPQAARWRGFLRPFSQALWAAMVAVVAVLLLLLWPLHFLDRQPDAHFLLIGAFLQQAPGGVARRGWFRVLLVAAHLTAVVLFSGYSASLVSSLASGNHRPIEDYWTMSASNAYHLHLVHGSKETSIITGNLQNIHMPPMPPGMRRPVGGIKGFETHMHMSHTRALSQVCRHDHNVALMHWSRMHMQSTLPPCPLDVVPSSVIHVDLVIPMRLDTPYLGLINYAINKMHQGGLFRRHLERASQLNNTLWIRYESVAFDNVCALLYFYMAVILGSLVILVLEKCTFNNCHRRLPAHSRMNFTSPLH